ncbi:Uncharacterised protein [Vibrio cholerae]|uniref:Uncharacterized protein n=1 Tax=Vibrio cholerae TaxID=666 RepID=A0A656AMQ4_VIBCL|nr:Uncharacterised protein [Vibrio cholerae]CSD21170.1 Uncharacterised protein [Vibrio cholerae]
MWGAETTSSAHTNPYGQQKVQCHHRRLPSPPITQQNTRYGLALDSTGSWQALRHPMGQTLHQSRQIQRRRFE